MKISIYINIYLCTKYFCTLRCFYQILLRTKTVIQKNCTSKSMYAATHMQKNLYILNKQINVENTQKKYGII